MPEVTRAQAGTYRQISHRLRVSHGPGKGETLSERPRARGGRYTDEDEPTMLTLVDGDQVDVPFLLQIGAIEPKAEAAKDSPKAAAREVPRGQALGG